jgi:pyruvate/2-oxoglutarate dehydrogenase complex dihydrolipoamide dehydrogenase (E3) component
LRETEDGVAIGTDDGILNAYRCVLAIGHGNRYTRPSWTAALDESAVDHVWDTSFELDDYGQAIVIGGGVTAAQTALALSERGNDVTLLARSGLIERTIEGDQQWQRWDHVRSELHTLPPGSRARLHRIREARYEGTVPSYLMRDVEAAVAENAISVVEGTVAQVRGGQESNPRLTLTDGRGIQADHVALATGFESPFEQPFVEQTASGLELARGHSGMPVLNDHTLAWNRRDGSPSSVHVVGALAAGSVGPFAGNIVGARMAASRLVSSVSFDCVRRSLAPVEQSVSP